MAAKNDRVRRQHMMAAKDDCMGAGVLLQDLWGDAPNDEAAAVIVDYLEDAISHVRSAQKIDQDG